MNERHHSYVEAVVHYHCGKCRSQWRISEGPTSGSDYLRCPRCGHLAGVEPPRNRNDPDSEEIFR